MSPKTLTGAELDLNDAPARDAELFLVDGNNLAYRAFFALPEELATTDGSLSDPPDLGNRGLSPNRRAFAAIPLQPTSL